MTQLCLAFCFEGRKADGHFKFLQQEEIYFQLHPTVCVRGGKTDLNTLTESSHHAATEW